MKLLLLSPGPSLRVFDGDYSVYDVVIAVNRAAAVYKSDWWSAGDYQTLEMYDPVGRPNLTTMSVSDDWLRANRPDLLESRSVIRWDWLAAQYSPPGGFSTYSATAALVLAKHLKADSVDAFGCDMGGVDDWLGTPGENRREQRWEEERRIWRDVVAWMGGNVTRHLK